jgi:hypothetical protein
MIRLALITKIETDHFCIRQFSALDSNLDPIPPELPMNENRLDGWLSTQGVSSTFRLHIQELNIGDNVWVRVKYDENASSIFS